MREAAAFTSDLIELGADGALTAGVVPAKTGIGVSILAFWAISEAVNALTSCMIPVT